MVIALVGVGGQSAELETVAGLALPGESPVATELWYSEWSDDPTALRWEQLWYSQIGVDQIEFRTRQKYESTRTTRSMIFRAAISPERWRIVVAHHSPNDDFSGYAQLRTAQSEWFFGYYSPSLVSGVLLGERSPFVSEDRHPDFARGVSSPGYGVGGIAAKYHTGDFTLAGGSGEFSASTQHRRCDWGNVEWRREGLPTVALSGLSIGHDSSNKREPIAVGAELQVFTDQYPLTASGAQIEDYRAFRVSQRAYHFGVWSVEFVGTSGVPPYEFGEYRYRGIRNGMWLQHQFERSWRVRSAVSASRTRTRLERYSGSVLAERVQASSLQPTILASAKADADGKIWAVSGFLRNGTADRWGIGSKFAYTLGYREQQTAVALNGYVTQQISLPARLTVWAATVASRERRLLRSVSLAAPWLDEYGNFVVSNCGVYAGGALEWRWRDFKFAGQFNGSIADAQRLTEFRISGGYSLRD